MSFTRCVRAIGVLTLVAFLAAPARAQAQSLDSAIDNLIQPQIANHGFAGAVLVTRDGDIVFDRAYGSANIDRHIENKNATVFHVGQLSMAWTAAIAMHLVEKGSLRLDNTVAQFLPGVPNGERITIRELLEGTGGTTPDIHAGYVLLARIVAEGSGRSFSEALNALLFAPYWMEGAGIDSDDLEPDSRYALGYVPDGKGGLKAADPFRWSEAMGDASLYATTRDELRFINLLFGDSLFTPETRATMFDGAKDGFGYGWYRRDDKALGGRFYCMNGRAGGFASFAMRIPAANATVILLGNVDAATTAEMGREIATLLLAGR